MGSCIDSFDAMAFNSQSANCLRSFDHQASMAPPCADDSVACDDLFFQNCTVSIMDRMIFARRI
eukprot:3935342-Pleurochrysis_carterae.AAC.1